MARDFSAKLLLLLKLLLEPFHSVNFIIFVFFTVSFNFVIFLFIRFFKF